MFDHIQLKVEGPQFEQAFLHGRPGPPGVHNGVTPWATD